jgi:NAD(P)-dependent dehydrogenase (short-subunit alcohol dehydrogenase family)
MDDHASAPTALIVGASRGLGWGLTREYARRGWHVIGTVRDASSVTPLHALVDEMPDRIEVETLEVTEPTQIAALRERLAGRRIDLLFVNAGITNDPNERIDAVSTEDFNRVLVTNTLSPLRIVEAMADLVSADGCVAVMSSGLGSIANNDDGGWDVYRASKAGVNMLMKSFAARRASERRTIYVIAPGWVRTDMGGPNASLDMETSMPGVADAIESRKGTRGLVYVDYQNQIVPW